MTEFEFALNTLYLVLSGAFVMWMAAGFTMLEAGLVRSKNVSEIVTKNLGLFSIACVMYLACGFYLMYPGDDVINAYIPGIGSTWGINLGGLTANYDLGYSDAADFFFQVVFVATAMSIVSGAVAERMKLSSFLLFCIVMTGLIYPIQGYWKWGGGFLDAAGFQDFAGSGVVHLCGAAAALAGVLLLGARKGKYENGKINAIPGANMPLATLGTFILWLGWFGFNGGSELMVSNVVEANAVALVFVNTCSIREKAEQTIRKRLEFYNSIKKKENKGMIVGVLGCMAERLKYKLLEEEKLVDIVVGPDAYRDLPNLIKQVDNGRKAVNVILSKEETYADISPVRLGGNGVTAFVSITRGCDNTVSYTHLTLPTNREV